jgi:glycosyltransferase involved in cell wall biosynthesis
MLSILMPVYNERERVERAISNVLATELPTDFELIVVDDGSTDGSGEILRSGGTWDGRANACFGVRAFDGYTSHSFLYVLGNKGVTLAANVLFNVYLRDIMTCHKMIRTELFRSLALREVGFAIEPEIAARLVQRGERIFEVPVQYHARTTEEAKKLTARDGVRVLRTLLRCRVSRA